jgi:L-ascorbate metabolism protein UlaG (beta-lactamase superfamily)
LREARVKELEVTYVSHASIRLRGQFGTLLADPWFLNEPVYTFTTWKFPPAVIPPDQVAQGLDYLFISHAHEDHFHVPSIDALPRDVTVLLPEYVNHPGLRAQTVERVMRALGFHRIVKLRPWQTYMLGGNTPLTIVPPCETKYWDWENAGFVLEHPDCKLLNMNDCPSDKALYAEVKKRFGRLDIGFVQYSGVSNFPGCYRMSHEEMREASSKRKVSWIQQRNMIEYLEVDRLAPFAGDFAWLDDRMLHCNWSNRATPKLFEDFVRTEYPDRAIEVLVMCPSDVWSKGGGLTRNHPEIDWSRYLDLIAETKRRLEPKVQAVRKWLDGASLADLEARSRAAIDHINKWISQAGIDFKVRVRVVVEGKSAGFSAVMAADPASGFAWRWGDTGPVDQTLYIDERLWAAWLDGRILLNNIQWAAQNEQHVEFRLEIAHFWFWFEEHIDLNNRNPQALIDRALHPWLEQRIRPRLGVFPQVDEWQCRWLEAMRAGESTVP